MEGKLKRGLPVQPSGPPSFCPPWGGGECPLLRGAPVWLLPFPVKPHPPIHLAAAASSAGYTLSWETKYLDQEYHLLSDNLQYELRYKKKDRPWQVRRQCGKGGGEFKGWGSGGYLQAPAGRSDMWTGQSVQSSLWLAHPPRRAAGQFWASAAPDHSKPANVPSQAVALSHEVGGKISPHSPPSFHEENLEKQKSFI